MLYNIYIDIQLALSGRKEKQKKSAESPKAPWQFWHVESLSKRKYYLYLYINQPHSNND